MGTIVFPIELQQIINSLTDKENQEIRALIELYSQQITLNKDGILMLKVDIDKISSCNIVDCVESLKSIIQHAIVAIITNYKTLPREEVVMQLEGVMSRLKNE